MDDSRVQKLLTRMTGMELDRVFVSRREPLALPRYKLMDEQQLKKVTSTLLTYTIMHINRAC